MTFLETLQTHRGGLLRIKSELFWYGGRGWDGAPGRVCLLLDAGPTGTRAAAAARSVRQRRAVTGTPALLLIDDAPHWIWVGKEDVELIT